MNAINCNQYNEVSGFICLFDEISDDEISASLNYSRLRLIEYWRDRRKISDSAKVSIKRKHASVFLQPEIEIFIRLPEILD